MFNMRRLRVFTWFLATVALVVSCALFFEAPANAAGPDYFQYQVEFPKPPSDGQQALNTLKDRAIPALTAVACGSEFDFLSMARAKKSNEDITNLVIGKMDWFGGHHDRQGAATIHASVCRATTTLFRPADLISTEWDALRAGDVNPANALFAAQFGMRCGPSSDSDGTPIKGVVASSHATSSDAAGAVTVSFTVAKACMWDEINASLSQMAVVGQMGTDGLRCMRLGRKRQGDWDMSLRNLTRIIYLDERYHEDILRTDVRNHVRNELLTGDGAPADETYSLLGCGNTEESTGTAQDRADERSWSDDFLDSLGDFFSSLLTILLIILAIILIIVGIFFPPAELLGAILLVAAAGVAAAAAFITTINIPETENHLLMINSSKYLNNQLIIKDLLAQGNNDDARDYQDDQQDLKNWFMSKITKALREEFIEYNSRPYSRLTIGAIYNLVDFCYDDDLRLAAQMTLDFTLSKYFVGSHEARRFLPFRRKREAVRISIIEPIDPNKTTGLFDQVELADNLISLGLYYSGQVQQIAPPAFGDRNISLGTTRNMLIPITSFYLPEPYLLDLAINKQNIYQWFKYASAEVYSSGPGFLISAGGVTSGLAYSGSGIKAVDLLRDDAEDDLGTALPTSLFLSGAPDHSTLDSLIRIEGVRDDEGKFRTYDHNLCVWGGFACGLNVTVPSSFEACVTRTPVPAQPEWGFIDTAACSAFSGVGSSPNVPRLFIVLYREGCRSRETGCALNFGFVEVIEAGSEPLPAFIARIVAANPKGFIVPFAASGGSGGSLPMSGVYHSARGEDIHFEADAHQNNSDKWGIISVNGKTTTDFGDWDFARGDVFTAKRDGFVHIVNPATGQEIEFDMTDEKHPKRKPK